MNSLVLWCKSTALSGFITGHYWAWPTLEIFHFVGLTLLIGCIGMFDLRVLGVGKRLPIAPLTPLMQWGVLGFVINMVSGSLFFVGQPDQYATNISFYFKMLFVMLAGLNVVAYYVFRVNRSVEAVGADADAPRSAKVIAATSLFLWFGVLYFGRMLPYLGNAF